VSVRTVNTTLFLLVAAQWLSGLGAFLAGSPGWRWAVWLHAAGGCAIVVLLAWKAGVIIRSLRRHRAGLWAVPSLVLLGLLLASLATGLLWSTVGLPALLELSGLTWHVILAVALLPLFLPHVWKARPLPRPREFVHRRRFFQRAAVVLGGVALWQGSEAAAATARLPGHDRRFTGSRDAGGVGADFPRTSWLLDDPQPIPPATWRLHVAGHVRQHVALTVDDLSPVTERRAVLDCTGGWYADRVWYGVGVGALLDQAGIVPGARSVVVRGVTGYARRFSLAEVRGALLATRVGAGPLGHGHGGPARLVVPGHRGYDWVKWVTRIEVSRAPAWWNWPLPLR
jgi:hypothetical protein